MRRAVFLDRDGVLNRAIVKDGVPHPPANPGELEILAGNAEACRELHAAGFLLIMVTNQPDVARGTQTRETVEVLNELVSNDLRLDDVRVCYHDDADACQCRKPAPGLLLEAAQQWNINLARSFIVGDRSKDIEAGQRAGCQTIFLDRGYDEDRPHSSYVTASLVDAAQWIVSFGRQNDGKESSNENA